MYQRCYALGII